MKKYGFFGGSFNPVTKAHIQLALDSMKKFNLDKVIFVPVGNTYQKEGLIAEQERYHMLVLATSQEENLEVSDIELGTKTPLTTIEAFDTIKKHYQEVESYFILGADNLANMPVWYKVERLVKEFQYIVIQRKGYDIEEIIEKHTILKENKQHFHRLENLNYGMASSTVIRNYLKIKDEKAIEELLDKKVYQYIKEKGLYP